MHGGRVGEELRGQQDKPGRLSRGDTRLSAGGGRADIREDGTQSSTWCQRDGLKIGVVVDGGGGRGGPAVVSASIEGEGHPQAFSLTCHLLREREVLIPAAQTLHYPSGEGPTRSHNPCPCATPTLWQRLSVGAPSSS